MKKILIVIGILSLLLLVGCDSINSEQHKEELATCFSQGNHEECMCCCMKIEQKGYTDMGQMNQCKTACYKNQ